MERKEGPARRVRVNISVTEETSRLLKEAAASRSSNVSQIISDWIWEENYKKTVLKRKHLVLDLDTDTVERLEQLAFEQHCSVDQAVTAWVWKSKVTYEVLRGQLSLDM